MIFEIVAEDDPVFRDSDSLGSRFAVFRKSEVELMHYRFDHGDLFELLPVEIERAIGKLEELGRLRACKIFTGGREFAVEPGFFVELVYGVKMVMDAATERTLQAISSAVKELWK